MIPFSVVKQQSSVVACLLKSAAAPVQQFDVVCIARPVTSQLTNVCSNEGAEKESQVKHLAFTRMHCIHSTQGMPFMV